MPMYSKKRGRVLSQEEMDASKRDLEFRRMLNLQGLTKEQYRYLNPLTERMPGLGDRIQDRLQRQKASKVSTEMQRQRAEKEATERARRERMLARHKRIANLINIGFSAIDAMKMAGEEYPT